MRQLVKPPQKGKCTSPQRDWSENFRRFGHKFNRRKTRAPLLPPVSQSWSKTSLPLLTGTPPTWTSTISLGQPTRKTGSFPLRLGVRLVPTLSSQQNFWADLWTWLLRANTRLLEKRNLVYVFCSRLTLPTLTVLLVLCNRAILSLSALSMGMIPSKRGK